MSWKELNNNNYLKWGFTLIFFLLATYGLLVSYGYANEFVVPLEEEFQFQFYECRSPWGGRPQQNLDYQKAEWQEAYDNHHYHAVRTYTDAYNRAWWLPDIKMRQLCRNAWVAACATAGGSTISGRLVIAFATMLSSYGLHCLDEWEYIEDKLSWSEYHFGQCAYYADLLHK